MGIEQILKIGAFFLSAVATWKVIIELLRGRQGRLREEYKFAKAFFEHLQSEPNLHPFLKEKVEWGMVPYVQAMLLARYLRGDLDSYPVFLWK